MADRDDYKIGTLLITGGAGFIGSNFISYIMGAHPDYRVVCVDKLTYAGSMDNLAPVSDRENFNFIRWIFVTGRISSRCLKQRSPILL